MSLKMQCTDCKKSYKVEDSWAGKRVKCKACGNIMVVPTPVVAVEEPAWDDMAGLESAATAAPAAYIAPPPAYHEVAPPATPYITIPSEDLIDRWVPWAGVGLFGLSLIIAIATAVSSAGSTPSLSKLPAGATAIALVIAAVVILVGGAIITTICGALMLLGVWIGSQIMKFPNQRLLYWRCLAAAGATLGVNSLLSQMGLDIVIVRGILAIAGGAGILWLLLRLRLPQFALSGGLAMLLGYLIPALMLLGLQAALKSFVPTPPIASSAVAPPSMSAGSPFAPTIPSSTHDPRIALQQTSAAHLKQINQALTLYAQDHQNAGPQTLENLVPTENLSAENLSAPAGLQYRYLGYFPQEPSSAVVAYEVGNRAVLGGVTVLFRDGTIQFFPENSADPLIANATNNPPSDVFNTPPPPQVPQFPRMVIPQPNLNPPQPQPQVNRPPVDATPLLQKVASAYQSYFSSHNSTYPRSVRDLLTAGLLKQEDLQLGTGQVLHSTITLPKIADLPGEAIVAYVLDIKAGTYTILFGDWHVQSMSINDFREAQTKSRKALVPRQQ